LEPQISGVSAVGMESGWTSQVVLVFLPADQWTVRALVSVEHQDLNTIAALSAEAIDQSRIGVAIGVDYKIMESMRMDFGYGLFRNTDHFKTALPESHKTDGLAGNGDHPGIQIFSARLKIKF
jgi:long-subunit fatty acid transport protein